MPTIAVSDNKKLVFVSRAVAKDDTRIFMDGFQIDRDDYDDDKKIIVATDGKRLHIAETELDTDNLIVGHGYKVHKVRKTDVQYSVKSNDYTFPNWHRVMPSDVEDTDLVLDFATNNKTLHHKGICNLIQAMPKGTGLNLDYLKDLMGFTWNVGFGKRRDEVHLVRFTVPNTHMVALIATTMLS